MPTYEYECEKCGHRFELFQSMNDRALATCPKEHCAKKPWGKGKVRRLLGTGGGIIFKGSGFYITDYRSENYKAAAKKDTSSTSSTPAPAPAASSSDSKPAAKSEAKSDAKPKSKPTST